MNYMDKESMGHSDENMKKALASRRGKGLDIGILIGEPHEDESDRSKTDLAPKPEAMKSAGDLHGASEVPQLHGQDQESPHDEEGHDGLAGMKENDLVSHLSEEEKHDAINSEPKSLIERAKKAFLSKGMKKSEENADNPPNKGVVSKIKGIDSKVTDY